MSIEGFHVIKGTNKNTLKWIPYGNPVSIIRYRVALETAPGPWDMVYPDYVSFLVPSTSGIAGMPYVQRKLPFGTRTFPDAIALAAHINTMQINNIKAQAHMSTNTVSIMLDSTADNKFLRAFGGSAIPKLGLTTDMVTTFSNPQVIGVVDPDAEPLPEYQTFEDTDGLPTDQYQLQYQTEKSSVMSPAEYMLPVTIIHGTLYKESGEPFTGLQVKMHAVPPQEPAPPGRLPLEGPGWPFTWLRPLDYSIFTQQCTTDASGRFQFVCARGLRVWVEIPTTGFGSAFDVPADAAHININTMPEWRRTGMLGPYDTGSGNMSSNLGGGNSDA